MHRCRNKSAVALIFPLCLTAVSGCGSDRPAVAPVSGKVLYKGKPLQFGTVIFVPTAGRPSQGDIQPDGTFKLSTYKTHDGATVGRCKAQVSCTADQDQKASPQPARGKTEAPEVPAGQSLIPAKYGNHVTSGLVFDVANGDNHFTIDLKN